MTLNPDAATTRYIDSLGPAALQKAHDYTVGKEWMLLWALLVAAVVTWLIVRSGILDWISRKLLNLFSPIERRLEARVKQMRGGIAAFLIGALCFVFAAILRNLRVFVVTFVYLVVSAILSLPWDLYANYFREKAYGRTSQPLSDYLVQGSQAVLVSAIVAGLFFVGVYWLMRRTGKSWWLWSGGLTAVVLAVFMLLSPILIEPIFNQYTAVPPGPVRDAVVAMAGRAGVPPERVFMFNGSRQSNNFTANAGGVGSTARVAISDVALKNASLDEVRAVTGHEIGHYVLKHTWYGILFYSVAAIILFWIADRTFPWFARKFGSSAILAEPRGLPVLMFMVSLLGLLTLPIFNSFSRMVETQADAYSLRTENRPDALSTALVKTAEYRYPRPGKLEEIVFYDHPSVERRVHTAMEWKAAHPEPPTP